MDRPSRNRKTINYSDFRDDDDEDFAEARAPPSKKSRATVNEQEPQKTNSDSKSSSQGSNSLSNGHRERVSLDDKLYNRDLEAALTLSLLQTSEEPVTGGKCQPLLSNCSVDGNCLGLDEISREQTSPKPRQRQAASRATQQHKKQLEEDGAGDEDYKPQNTPDSDSDFSEADESEDEEFTVKKPEKKKTAKKEKKAAPQTTKKEKKPPKAPRAKAQLSGPSPAVNRSPGIVGSVSTVRRPPTTPSASKPAISVSPAGGRIAKWNPPGQVGRSPGSSQAAPGRSPGQGLRLGLSRLARVKPLHPNAPAH